MNKSISFQGWRLGHILLVIILSLGVIHTVEAQQSSKVRRVGYVATGSEESTRELREIARRTYADLGYREGKNLRIDMRYAEGRFEQGPRLFTELLEADAEVLGTSGYQLAAAAIQVTRNVPVVRDRAVGHQPSEAGWQFDGGDLPDPRSGDETSRAVSGTVPWRTTRRCPVQSRCDLHPQISRGVDTRGWGPGN